MEENQTQIDYGEKIAQWDIPEFEKHERTKSWYTKAISASLLLLVFSFLTANFLFAVIIIIASLIFVLRHGQEPDRIKVILAQEGIIVGRQFYDYDEFKNFAIVHKPSQNVKNLYFEFKSALKQRLSIPLEKMDPLSIRKNLLKYLPEDLERTDIPFSEQLSRLFKL